MANEKRLIDANARIEEIKKAYCTDCENYNGIRCRACWVDDAIGLMGDASTVDAVEVVRGRWVSSGCGFDVCSECRKVYADGYLTAMGIKPRTQFNYCPNCGAKMDGGNEDVQISC